MEQNTLILCPPSCAKGKFLTWIARNRASTIISALGPANPACQYKGLPGASLIWLSLLGAEGEPHAWQIMHSCMKRFF